MRSLGYRDVRLTESRFAAQLDATIRYYQAIPNDSLLHGFRRRAGRPAPGQPLGGWYGAGFGHAFGQYLGAYAKMYAITGDDGLLSKARALLDGWAECIEADGYGFNNAAGSVPDLHYEYEKLLGGLLDLAEHAGVPEALDHADRLTGWAERNLSRRVRHTVTRPDRLESNEWYTLSENLYRAYQLTGNERYRAFAAEWEYELFWRRLRDDPAACDAKHAYSHVNSLSGAAMAYRVTGELRYLRTMVAAFDEIAARHRFATGGYGPREELFHSPGYLGESLLRHDPDGLGSTEVPCCTWAAFKLCRYLIEATGEARYADWTERLLYNGIGAHLMPHDDGQVQYYADYTVLGSHKTPWNCTLPTTTGWTQEWHCCSGTYPHDVCEYVNLIAYVSDGTGAEAPAGLYLSQYLPARVETSVGGQTLAVRIDTDYPDRDRVTVVVERAPERPFHIGLRIPDWVDGAPEVTTPDGAPIASDAGPGTWLPVERTWSAGDRIDLRLPMPLYFAVVDEQHQDVLALHHGPTVLARAENGVLTGDLDHPSLWIERARPDRQHFRTAPGHVLGYPERRFTFKPYAEVPAGERSYVYSRAVTEWEALGGPPAVTRGEDSPTGRRRPPQAG